MFNEKLHDDIADGLIDECREGTGYSIDTGVGNCIVARSGTLMRMFIECDTPEFFDSFNGLEIFNSSYNYQGKIMRGIELTCDSPITDPFISISIDLLCHIQKNGGQASFQSWCDGWKEMVGNRLSEQRVYDALAELIAYGYLLDTRAEPSWCGPDYGRHDIVCEKFDCEVKSTSCRTGALMIETGSLQLLPGSKPLYLFVCQFEYSPEGEFSIDLLKKYLITKGVDKNELTDKIKKAGLNTTKYLHKKFNLLQPMKKYNVDDDFPHLACTDFVGGKCPANILNVRYSVILDGLNSTDIIVTADADRIINYSHTS